MANNNTKELNAITVVLGCLLIFNHVRLIFQSLFFFALENDPLWLVNLLQSIVIITIITFILKKRKWAVYSFFAFQVLNVIFINIIQNGSSEDVAISIGKALLFSTVLVGLLCLKKNGVTGWYAIFNDEGLYKVFDSDYKESVPSLGAVNENMEYLAEYAEVETLPVANFSSKNNSKTLCNNKRNFSAVFQTFFNGKNRWMLLTILILVVVVVVESVLLLSKHLSENNVYPHEITQEQKSFRQEIYYKMRDLDYNVGCSYHVFDSLLNYRMDSRKLVYNKAIEAGLYEDTFEQFENKIGERDRLMTLYFGLIENGIKVSDLGGSFKAFVVKLSVAAKRDDFYDWLTQTKNMDIGTREEFHDVLSEYFNETTSPFAD